MTNNHFIVDDITTQATNVVNSSPLNYTVSNKIDIVNCTDFTITMIDKDNVRFQLEPSNGRNLGMNNAVYITKDISVGSVIKVDASAVYRETEFDSQYSVASREVYNNLNNSSRLINGSVKSQSLIYSEELERNKSIYIPQYDVLLVFGNIADTKDYSHPKTRLDIEDFFKEETDNLSIVVVDKQNHYDKLYVNINGIIYPVPKIKNSHWNDGFYIFIKNNDVKLTESTLTNLRAKHGIQFKYLNIHDALDSKWLFNTVKDAEQYGDYQKQNDNFKLELEKEKELIQKKLQEKYEIQKRDRQLELEELKHEHAKQEIEYNTVLRDKEREVIEANRDLANEKHRYERLSNDRKLMTEMFKTIPVMITGVVGLVALYGKYSK